MGLLDRVNQPADLLRLSPAELATLAEEIRQTILKTVAANQGHLSSNLGVVELTMAMHIVFESPRDRILWDVGHQCYTHKLLTGRRDGFPTLRKTGGLSGFPKPAESPHDWFHTGHAGTALSSALGLAVARDLKGETGQVIAVVGDGSFPNGMSMEAANQIGHLKPDMIVVLNDNEMAISKAVGAMSQYLTRIITSTRYGRFRDRVRTYLERYRRVGPAVSQLIKRLEADVTSIWGPGVLFEELGFRYLGPFDGNDIALMAEVFRQARFLKGPTLIHAVTKKGHGFAPAEADPITYYSPAGFDVVTGALAPKKAKLPSWSDAFTDALIRLAGEDPRIVAVTAAMLEGTMLKKFQERFPGRIHDVGIAEEHAVGFAGGLAAGGLRPVVAIYSTFMQRAYDQVMHDVCLQNLPVVLAMDRGGLVGEDGPTHHGVFDFAFLRHLPNLVVMAPSDENELVNMLATALSLNHPSSIRFPRGQILGVPVDPFPKPLPVGKGRLLREGNDVALIAIGTQVSVALAVADRLAAERGIRASVVDARFVKPLDEELIVSLAGRCGRIVTMEEHVRMGGFGSAVLELLAVRNIRVPVHVLALPDAFVEQGHPGILRERYCLAPGPAFEAVARFLGVRGAAAGA
ncbi:MAG: 1-deoxy-D-xylulose-5-phosphate synthase [Candidatus Coatesbacteria bacterium]